MTNVNNEINNFDLRNNPTSTTFVVKSNQVPKLKVDTLVNKKITTTKKATNVDFHGSFKSVVVEYLDEREKTSVLEKIITSTTPLIEKEEILCELFVLNDKMLSLLSKSYANISVRYLKNALVILNSKISNVDQLEIERQRKIILRNASKELRDCLNITIKNLIQTHLPSENIGDFVYKSLRALIPVSAYGVSAEKSFFILLALYIHGDVDVVSRFTTTFKEKEYVQQLFTYNSEFLSYISLLAFFALRNKKHICDFSFILDEVTMRPPSNIFLNDKTPSIGKNDYSRLLKMYHIYFKCFRSHLYQKLLNNKFN